VYMPKVYDGRHRRAQWPQRHLCMETPRSPKMQRPGEVKVMTKADDAELRQLKIALFRYETASAATIPARPRRMARSGRYFWMRMPV